MKHTVYIPVDIRVRKNLKQIETPKIYDYFKCSEELILLDKHGNHYLGWLKIWTSDFYILNKLVAKKGKIEFEGTGYVGAKTTHYLKRTTLKELNDGSTEPKK